MKGINVTAAEYKAAKEAFISGLSGGSMMEIVLLILPVPAGLWLHAEVKVRLLMFGNDHDDSPCPREILHPWMPPRGVR